MSKELKLFMMSGLPASGKSTLAKQLAEDYDAIIFSSDAYRKKITGSYKGNLRDGEVFSKLETDLFEMLFNKGKNVIYDACNMNSFFRKRIASWAKDDEETYNIKVKKVLYLFRIPVKQCLENNHKREYSCPEHLIIEWSGTRDLTVPKWEAEYWDDIIYVDKNNF